MWDNIPSTFIDYLVFETEAITYFSLLSAKVR